MPRPLSVLNDHAALKSVLQERKNLPINQSDGKLLREIKRRWSHLPTNAFADEENVLPSIGCC